MINDKDKTLCNSKGVKFVNFWASYIDNGSLYNSDGMHLSKKGKEKLVDLINLNLYNLLCKSGNCQSGQIDKIGQQTGGGSDKILKTQSVNSNISINKGKRIMAIYINMKAKIEEQQILPHWRGSCRQE